MDRYGDMRLDAPVDAALLATQQAEMTIDQLFASTQVSPTDNAQSSVALNWTGQSTFVFPRLIFQT